MNYIVDSGQPNANKDAILNGTKTTTVRGVMGQALSRQTKAITNGVYGPILSQETMLCDQFGRATNITYLDGTSVEREYGCCDVDWEIDREGVTTYYNYDSLKRLFSTVRNGIATIYVHDAAGNRITTTRQGTGGSSIDIQRCGFDLAGQMTAETNALDVVTAYTNYFENGFYVKKTIYAAGTTNEATSIEWHNQDGSLAKLTGTAVHPVRYEYGAEAAGAYTKEIKLNSDGTDSGEWTKTYTDMLGRAYKTVYADNAYRQSFYNNQGQLWKERDPDGVITLYQYNAKGELEYSAVDLDQDSVINFSGADRITKTVRDVTTYSGSDVQRMSTYVYTTDNSTATALISTVQTSTDSLRTWQTIYKDSTNAVITQTQTAYDAPNQRRTVTVTAPDGTQTVTVYQDGRLQSVTRKESDGDQVGQTSYEYDPHGRTWKVTDARNGTTIYSYNAVDQVTSVTTPAPGTGQPAQTTATQYDAMGRPWKITYPDGASLTNEYYLTGELKRTYGSRTYPVGYGYDAQGRMTTMTNWTTFASAGERVTTWN